MTPLEILLSLLGMLAVAVLFGLVLQGLIWIGDDIMARRNRAWLKAHSRRTASPEQTHDRSKQS